MAKRPHRAPPTFTGRDVLAWVVVGLLALVVGVAMGIGLAMYLLH